MTAAELFIPDSPFAPYSPLAGCDCIANPMGVAS